MRCPAVCPSVRPSHSWIVSKRINISSKFFHHRVAKPVFRTKRHGTISTGTHPLTGASNAGGVRRTRDSEPISGFTACCELCQRQLQYRVYIVAAMDNGEFITLVAAWQAAEFVDGGKQRRSV